MGGSKGHGRGKARNGSQNRSAEAGKFRRDTAAAIEKLEGALLRVRKRKRGLETSLPELERKWHAEVGVAKQSLLPDLTIRTISRLNVAVPGFLTDEMQRSIAAARNPKVPFWTWIFGGGKAYKQAKLRDMRNWLLARLDAHLEGLKEKPAAFAQAAATAARYHEMKRQLDEVTLHEQSLEKQLKGLHDVQTAFSRGDRRIPKEMAEAVAKASRPQSAPSATSPSGSGSDFDYVHDVLIPDIIWDSYFDRRGGHYYDRGYSPRREPSYRRDDSDDVRPSTRGSREDSPHRDGNASSRMDDAAPARTGDASARMSDAAPSRDGNASTRMSDMTRGAVIGAAASSGMRSEPVIAEPFGESSSSSEGNASAHMSDFSDRSESGPGTSY